jgi:acyl-coenzyme A synthetase/AMP-(fatty) acid ligase
VKRLIPFVAGQIVACYRGQALRAEHFAAHAEQVAAALPQGQYLINACVDRYHFAVGLAAAMLRGQISLLPSSTAPRLVRELAADYPGLYLLADQRVDDPVLELCEFPDLRTNSSTAIPAFAPEQISVIAFTSGSTGRPTPHSKTWGGLTRGALDAARRLGLAGAREVSIVATVPAQHMYGLESSVILPLQNAHALHAGRPFYPEDVRAALQQWQGERVLVTTPVHLRSLLDSEASLPPLRLIVCATAPLSRDLARQCEARFGAAVHEIYGFTEAGQVASRRTVEGAVWQLLPDVHMRTQDGAVWVRGGAVEREVASSDVLEVIDAETFLLHGRGADMVNIAGKRTSLAYLSQQLCAIDGVNDAVVFLAEQTGAEVTRPIAFVVAPGMTRATVIDALRERVDAVFVPRPLYLVDALPRNATGKLPRDALQQLLRGAPVDAGGDA